MVVSGRLRGLFDRPFKVVFPSSAPGLARGKGRAVQACGPSAGKQKALSATTKHFLLRLDRRYQRMPHANLPQTKKLL